MTPLTFGDVVAGIGKRGAMPTVKNIMRWWATNAVDFPEHQIENGWDIPCCWGCGGEQYDLQRSHLVSHYLGGSAHPSNLVLLCKRCHAHMPDFVNGEREQAILWVRTRPDDIDYSALVYKKISQLPVTYVTEMLETLR